MAGLNCQRQRRPAKAMYDKPDDTGLALSAPVSPHTVVGCAPEFVGLRGYQLESVNRVLA